MENNIEFKYVIQYIMIKIYQDMPLNFNVLYSTS